MIVVDTNVWSETLRSAPDQRVLEWMRRHSTDLHMPVVCVHELRYGTLILPEGSRRDRLSESVELLLDRLAPRVLDYDRSAARCHASVRAEARAAGRPLSAEDGQILGIAAAHDATVATRNVRDLDGFGVDLVNPWD